jgi:hypothetical protein
MVISHAGYRKVELVGVGPVGLNAFAHLVDLGEEDLLRRPVTAQPLRNPSLEGTERPAVNLFRKCSQEILEQRFSLHLGALVQPPLRLGPDPT